MTHRRKVKGGDEPPLLQGVGRACGRLANRLERRAVSWHQRSVRQRDARGDTLERVVEADGVRSRGGEAASVIFEHRESERLREITVRTSDARIDDRGRASGVARPQSAKLGEEIDVFVEVEQYRHLAFAWNGVEKPVSRRAFPSASVVPVWYPSPPSGASTGNSEKGKSPAQAGLLLDRGAEI
jgi:hypothetical protein